MTELTPALVSRMLSIWERRQRDPRNTVYPTTLLEAALQAPDPLPPPARMFEFDGGLKRSWWKRG